MYVQMDQDLLGIINDLRESFQRQFSLELLTSDLLNGAKLRDRANDLGEEAVEKYGYDNNRSGIIDFEMRDQPDQGQGYESIWFTVVFENEICVHNQPRLFIQGATIAFTAK